MKKSTTTVMDNLPTSEELAAKSDLVRTTIYLSKHSVEFFKHEAEKNHTHYQKLIRRLLDAYTKSAETEMVGGDIGLVASNKARGKFALWLTKLVNRLRANSSAMRAPGRA